MPYSDDYEPIKNIHVVQGATAYDIDETGETIILIYNQSLYFGDRLDHTLTNPYQLQAFWHSVCDDPYDPNQDLRIHIQGTDIFIPFATKGTTVLFNAHVPTIQENRVVLLCLQVKRLGTQIQSPCIKSAKSQPLIFRPIIYRQETINLAIPFVQCPAAIASEAPSKL